MRLSLSGLTFLITFLFYLPGVFAQTEDKITITTYYPSPYGSYNEMGVFKRQAIGDLNNDGKTDAQDMAVDNFGNPLPGTLTVAERVGIGTTTPIGQLHIKRESGQLLPVIFEAPFNENIDLMFTSPDQELYHWDLTKRGSNEGHILALIKDGVGPPVMSWTKAGDVGIGTESPEVELYVKSNTEHADIATESSDGYKWTMSTAIGGNWVLNRDIPGTYPIIVAVRTADGKANVGIGTGDPGQHKLKIVGASIPYPIVSVENTQVAGGPGQGVVGAMRLVVVPNNDPYSSILDLYGGGGTDRKFYFNSMGSGRADSDFAGGGADYAEYFDNLNEQTIEKATIVALENAKVRVARKGDSFIAGVVSTAPGIVGNNGDIEEERDRYPERWTLVALMGQVSVKVRGVIKQGDYIELDDNGIGKKAAQWHPDVIGRAMEDYHSGEIAKIKCLIK
jgi:hypothetical protein